MSRIRGHLTYANVMVTILAFLVLGGGSAVALSGSNTVFSDDVVNNQVRSADVRDDTLTGGGLAAVDLRAGSVGGSEVKSNSLTGADVKESSLGPVRQAANAGTLDGLDSTHFGTGVMGGLMKDAGFNAVVSGTQYAPAGVSTPSASGPFVAPVGGFVARDLQISLASPNGAGETQTFLFATVGSDLSCTVPENASSCSDTTHAVPVSAGQTYSMFETALTGSPGTMDVRFGWRAVSP